MSSVIFTDRLDAGRRLGQAVAKRAVRSPLILCLPRGGVPVGLEVARALHAPMDILICRKVGTPHNAELAAAVVVEGPPEHITFNAPVLRSLGLDPDDLMEDIARETRELHRRAAVYRPRGTRMSVKGRNVILVDDGIATGTTIRAAIDALRRQEPTSIGVAVRVAAPESLRDIRRLADWVICLSAPEPFEAVGVHYVAFPQLSDGEVLSALRQGVPLSEPATGT